MNILQGPKVDKLLQRLGLQHKESLKNEYPYRFLVITDYNDHGALCPHCKIAKKAYEMAESENVDPTKRIAKVFANSGEPIVDEVAYQICRSFGIDGVVSPMLVCNGFVYFGHRGVDHYYGLANTLMS